MNVSLPPELEQLVEKRARERGHGSPSDIVREGLEFFFSHERELRASAFGVTSDEQLEEKLLTGVADLNSGKHVAANDAREILKERLKQRPR